MLLFYGLSPCWYLILHICWCPNSIYNAFTMIIVSCSCFEIYALSHFNLCDELRGHFVECLSWTEPVFLIWPSRFWADFTSHPPPCHLMLTVSVRWIDRCLRITSWWRRPSFCEKGHWWCAQWGWKSTVSPNLWNRRSKAIREVHGAVHGVEEWFVRLQGIDDAVSEWIRCHKGRVVLERWNGGDAAQCGGP